MNWVIAGLDSSLLMGVMSEVNRRFKLDGFRLNFWRSLVITVLLFPAMLVVDWPKLETSFYLTAFLSGITASVGMTLLLNLSANHNGRIAALYSPIKMFTLYAVWLLIDGQARTSFTQNHFHALGDMPILVPRGSWPTFEH